MKLSKMGDGMTSAERRGAFGLAAIVSLRMLGLFLIFPVFALYAEGLDGVTPLLVGLAVGAYGLTQALFQIPFGMASDRWGRKPVIVVGLLIFAAGSVLAAMSDGIWGVIAGRTLQGAGAVAAAVMALTADLTRESQRTKAMAIIGMSIGFSFMLALVIGPVLDHWVGVSGIFWLTGILALFGVVLLLTAVPDPADSIIHRDAEPVAGQFARVLHDTNLLRLDFGIFALHLVLTATFLQVPLALRDQGGLAPASHSIVYLVVLLLSVVLMVPLITKAERDGYMRVVFTGCIVLLAVAQVGLGFLSPGLWTLALWLLVLFTAFNVLEATLPSLISRLAPGQSKGTAMGVYSTSQFAGAFVGGALGGWLHQQTGADSVFLLGASVLALWLIFALNLRFPGQVSSKLVPVAVADDESAQDLEIRLRAVPGVVEATVVVEEAVAYLKVDDRRLDTAELDAIATSAA